MAGKRSPRDFLDMSSFTSNFSKFELVQKTVANTLAWDVYGGKTEFVATVLSTPIRLSQADASATDGSGTILSESEIKEAGKRKPPISTKFAFKARILGNPSPHDFLVDPCSLDSAGCPTQAYKLIALHTTFISVDDGTAEAQSIPKIGDIVNVELGIGDVSYDLQFGKYMSISTNTTAGMEGVGQSKVAADLAAQAAKAAGEPVHSPGPISCFHLGGLFIDFDSDLFAGSEGTSLSVSLAGALQDTSAEAIQRNKLIDSFWKFVMDFRPTKEKTPSFTPIAMPTSAKVTSRGRTVFYGRNLVVRMARDKGIATHPGDATKRGGSNWDYDYISGLIDQLRETGLKIAIPEESKHCIGAGCRSGDLMAIDVGGAFIGTISDALKSFKEADPANQTGYPWLEAAGLLPATFATDGWTALYRDAGEKYEGVPKGWNKEPANKAVHIEIKLAQ